MHYLVSNVFGYGTGLIIAYLLNTRWVFRYRRLAKKTRLEFAIFTAIALIGLGINELVLLVMVSQLSTHYVPAKFVATFFVMVFNFVAKRQILFRPPREE
jgi:putative flippase GtrA